MKFCSNKNSLLLLFSGPRVIIHIGDHEYKLPKALLCEQSPYFQATFEGGFKEGEDQSTTLSEEDGVVSPGSFLMLVQWLTSGRVNFGEMEPEKAITCTIEFVRIADMYKVTGMETLMAERIKAIILAHRADADGRSSPPHSNTDYLTSQHINSALLLPEGHPVRRLLVSAVVKGYFLDKEPRFWKEAQENAEFAIDLLKEVKNTLNSLRSGRSMVTFMDPIRGETCSIRRR